MLKIYIVFAKLKVELSVKNIYIIIRFVPDPHTIQMLDMWSDSIRLIGSQRKTLEPMVMTFFFVCLEFYKFHYFWNDYTLVIHHLNVVVDRFFFLLVVGKLSCVVLSLF